MVFLSGPRQCGKTTIAQELTKTWKGAYYSWDIPSQKRMILDRTLDTRARLWALDELHKFRLWRNYLKGLYDEFHNQHSVLVTGSARLDVYHRSGDSLQGRYRLFRMHPLTLSEICKFKTPEKWDEIFELPTEKNSLTAKKVVKDLLQLGGFPEPYSSGSEVDSKRWRADYSHLLIREEVRELENLGNLDKLELLYHHLPRCVGSVLSINSFREDLDVAFETIRHWISVLENLYVVFRIAPFGSPKIRAVKKEQKLYFWDWTMVEDPAARFENLVALHLLRFTHWRRDVFGERCELRYLRDVTKRETDFLIVVDDKPWLAIETKLSERPVDPSLLYFAERIPFKRAFQVSLNATKDYESRGHHGAPIRVLSVERLLANLA
jgi:predicted AAA+ superfamily ATPase